MRGFILFEYMIAIIIGLFMFAGSSWKLFNRQVKPINEQIEVFNNNNTNSNTNSIGDQIDSRFNNSNQNNNQIINENIITYDNDNSNTNQIEISASEIINPVETLFVQFGSTTIGFQILDGVLVNDLSDLLNWIKGTGEDIPPMFDKKSLLAYLRNKKSGDDQFNVLVKLEDEKDDDDLLLFNMANKIETPNFGDDQEQFNTLKSTVKAYIMFSIVSDFDLTEEELKIIKEDQKEQMKKNKSDRITKTANRIFAFLKKLKAFRDKFKSDSIEALEVQKLVDRITWTFPKEANAKSWNTLQEEDTKKERVKVEGQANLQDKEIVNRFMKFLSRLKVMANYCGLKSEFQESLSILQKIFSKSRIKFSDDYSIDVIDEMMEVIVPFHKTIIKSVNLALDNKKMNKEELTKLFDNVKYYLSTLAPNTEEVELVQKQIETIFSMLLNRVEN